MKDGGIGSLMTTLPRTLGPTSLFFVYSSKIFTSNPGQALVTLPGRVG